MTEAQNHTIPSNWKMQFFPIWASQIFSILGSSLVQFALIWYLTQKTGSATILATATLVGMIPGVILGPFAGALVDRWNRRLVMIIADGSVALATIVLVILFWTGLIQIWHIYIIMFFRSLVGCFHYPAWGASTALMVPKEHMARISGLNQAMYGVLNIISPPLGALLMSVLPMYGVLSIDIGTAAIAIAPLLFVAIPQPKALPKPASSENMVITMLKDTREGFRYVWSWTGLFLIITMATLINFLLNPAFSLLPLLVKGHFNGEVAQLALLEAVYGVGVVIGGLGLTAWGGFKRKILTTMLGLIGMGIGVVIMGFAPSSLFAMAVGGMALTGLMNPICNGPLTAIIQTTVEPQIQGRVMSVINSAASAMSPLSLLVAGPVSDAIGIQAWYVVGGFACVLMAVASLFIKSVMTVEDQRKPVGEGLIAECAALDISQVPAD